jgi:hypothetical protein
LLAHLETRSRKAWKEPTVLIGFSNWNIQSTGSRSPAHSGSQIEEGLERANHADWVLELKHSIRRMKVAYPLMKRDRRSFGSLPFILIWFSNWNSQSAGSRSLARSGGQIEAGVEGANRFRFRIGTFKAQDQGCLPARSKNDRVFSDHIFIETPATTCNLDFCNTVALILRYRLA